MGCHFLLQGNLTDPGIEPGSPAWQADALPSEPPGNPSPPENPWHLSAEPFIDSNSRKARFGESVHLTARHMLAAHTRLWCSWDCFVIATAVKLIP